ncbi:MAG TPA: hypothetical protein VGH81_11600 [Rudaea sp.]|jgi:hypothetical protein
MKTYRLCIAALVMLAGAFSAQAHEFDAGGKIIVSCRVERTPYMADVAHAVERSHYWATPNARREMLARARQACASGSTAVTFVPPPDQRYGAVADK